MSKTGPLRRRSTAFPWGLFSRGGDWPRLAPNAQVRPRNGHRRSRLSNPLQDGKAEPRRPSRLQRENLEVPEVSVDCRQGNWGRCPKSIETGQGSFSDRVASPVCQSVIPSGSGGSLHRRHGQDPRQLRGVARPGGLRLAILSPPRPFQIRNRSNYG